jgi:hypothetical protein
MKSWRRIRLDEMDISEIVDGLPEEARIVEQIAISVKRP